MSAYEALVERCARTARPFAGDYAEAVAKDILADAFRTLHTVTPDMEDAGLRTSYGLNTVEALAKDFLAMLRASPLAPPAGAP